MFLRFSRRQSQIEVDAHTEGSLAAEVSMVVLDTLELTVGVRGKHHFMNNQGNRPIISIGAISVSIVKVLRKKSKKSRTL